MGVGKSKNDPRKNSNSASEKPIDQKIIKEVCSNGNPVPKTERDELYRNESSMCKIIYQDIKDGKIIKISGTGFFCAIFDDNIPFKKALFTNNHVLNENRIEINKEIEIEYLKEMKKIRITNDRKVFTNEKFDYTCIEIFDTDNIKKFLDIDEIIFNNRNDIKNQEIFILQYAEGGELADDHGKIIDIKDNIIRHNVPTIQGSSGSPLIKRHYFNLVLGIRNGAKNDKTSNCATPFDIIINDIKNKLSYNKENLISNNNKNNNKYNNKNNNNFIEYINKINLIYYKKDNSQDEKDNITLIINDNENKLISKYNLKEGENNIEIKIRNKLTNLEYMLYECSSLKYIEELKN